LLKRFTSNQVIHEQAVTKRAITKEIAVPRPDIIPESFRSVKAVKATPENAIIVIMAGIHQLVKVKVIFI